MEKWQDAILNSNGQPVAGATVLVTPSGTNTATAVLYADIAGSATRANPLTADANGRAWFYGTNGRYDLIVSGSYIQTTTVTDVMTEDVPLSNLAELSTASAARTNLGLGVWSTAAGSFGLQSANNLSDLSTASVARANLGFPGAITTSTNSWTAGQRGAVVALASTGQISPNLDAGNNFSLAMTVNTTLATPSNVAGAVGQGGQITITQAGTAKTLTMASFYKFAGGVVGTLSTATGATDVLNYQIISTSAAACVMLNNFS